MALRASNLVPIPIPAPALAGTILSVPFIPQVQSNWCWAACGAMVLDYYGSSVQTCELANQQFQRQNCCTSPSSKKCNKGLADADITQLYPQNGLQQPVFGIGVITASDLQGELDVGQPIQLGWLMSGKGHVVLVVGWKLVQSDVVFRVHDPSEPSYRELAYDWLKGAAGLGSWEVTWTNLRT